MPSPVVIPVEQFLHFGPSQVGTQGVIFGKLFAEGIPLPETLLIPPETLYRIAQENKLFSVLSQSSQSPDDLDPTKLQKLKKHITKTLTEQKLPTWFLKELLSQYHRRFSEHFVAIIPANHYLGFDRSDFMHIQGEANLIESFLAAWAELVFRAVEKHHQLRQIHLAPTPIIIQAQHQPVVSGLGFTAHPKKATKSQVLIQAIWGSPDQQLLLDASDSFSVDVRSWQIVDQTIATKTKQYRREADKLISFPVPQQYQKHGSVTEEQVQAIAQIVFAIKQKRLSQQIVAWELTKEGIFITDITEDLEEALKTAPLKKTMTKLLISTGNPQKHLPHLFPAVEGIGVLRSEYTLAKFGIHPLHVIQSKQKQQLLKELVETIHTYQAALPLKPVIYRSQNFTSSELRQLRYSENYEPSEPNPYLGYRGGLQLNRQPQLLQFEIEVLKTALHKTQSSLAFLVPFVRTPHELEYIISEVERAGLFNNPHFSIWMQVNTPENILNLRSYPTHKLAGLSVNAKSLHALLLGIDPDNPEIYQHYTMDQTAVSKLLEQLAQTVLELQELRTLMQPLQLNLHLEDYSHDLVAQAVKLGYHGVVVKPAAAQITHTTISEIEEKQLAYLQ